MLDVTRLRVLVAVARHGSVTAAARALNYAQPSISHHIARLEAETGARLLQRAGRGVRLTDAGRLLAERAEEIIGRLDAAEAELAAHVGLREGRVRLAAFPSALGTIVPAAAARLEAETPGMDLMLTEAEPPEALRMLRAGYVDVALVFQHYQQDTDPAPPSAAEEGTRGRAAARRAGPPGHGRRRLRAGADGAAVDLAAYASTAGSRAASGAAATCSGSARGRVHAQVAFTTDDYVAVQALVAAGLGVTTLPGLCLRAARHPGIAAAALPGARRHVFAMTYGDPPDPPATARLLDVLAQVGRGHAATRDASRWHAPVIALACHHAGRSGQMALAWPCQYGSRSRRLSSLPLGSRGSSATKSMDLGHFILASLPSSEARISAASPSPGSAPGRLDHRLDLLAPVVVRDAEDGHVGHFGMHDDLGLDLGRVDVRPARDDHVGLPVAEEQEAVLVQVADVADGEESVAAGWPRSWPGRPCTRSPIMPIFM